VLRGDHPNIASSFNNLALAVGDLGKWPEAESLHRQSIELDRKIWGPTHISVVEGLNNLSHPLRHLGRYKEAEQVLNEALAIVKADDDAPIRGTLTTNMGRVYVAERRFEEAESYLRESLRLRRRRLAESDWRIGVTKSLLGEALTGRGRYEEAESFLLDAQKVLKGTLGPQGREAVATQERVAALRAARTHARR
jgi:tetratricopeptide (TPR) repeat protein